MARRLTLRRLLTGAFLTAAAVGAWLNPGEPLSWKSIGTSAQVTCAALPFTFVNGTLADGGQVNANFNAVVSCIQRVTNVPYVLTNAALKLASTATNPNGIWRYSFATGSTDGPLFYRSSGAACTLNSGAGDDGSQVPSVDGKCWLAVFPNYVEWRWFGCSLAQSDNATCGKNAAMAASRAGMQFRTCGFGNFTILSTIYYYNKMDWFNCPGTNIRMGGVLGFAGIAPASTPGDTFPTVSLFNVHLRNLSIDMQQIAGGGVGLLMQAVQVGTIEAPIVTGIPGKGTWTYTDKEGTGTLPNAGIALVGGGPANVENVTLSDALVGIFASGATYTSCPYLGGIGLAMTTPSQDKNLGNPANANIIRNSSFNCNYVGILNERGSHNRFVMDDTTWSAEYGLTIGSYGHVPYAISGGPSAGGGSICVIIASKTPALTGSPISSCHSTSAGDTPAVAVADIVSQINGNVALTGSVLAIHATEIDVGSDESIIDISWTEQNQLGVGMNFGVTTSDVMAISWAHNVSNNFVSQMQGEGTRYAMFYLGADALSTVLDNTGQMTNTPHLVSAVYGGPFGAQNPIVTNWFYFQQQHGTTITVGIPADPLNDPQPYLVNANSGDILMTMHGLLPFGSVVEFCDANESWGTHKVIAAAADAAYGTTVSPKVMGSTNHASFSGLGGCFKLINNGPDWIGGGPVSVTIP